MRMNELRIGFDGGGKASPRAIEITFGAKDCAQIVLRLSMSGIDVNRQRIPFLGLFSILLFLKGSAQVVCGETIPRFDLKRTKILASSLAEVTGIRMRKAEIIKARRISRFQCRR